MSSPETHKPEPWYAGVTRYEWLVLAIASAGWIFDAFEGQIFNITRQEMLTDLLASRGNEATVKWWGDVFLAVFLVGGTVGGVLFGSLADRFGRKPTMVVTILLYSLFSGLTAFSTELWHVAVLRFLVAMGVGGEWAVAASLVAEVFPSRARAHASGIFHATSVLSTWLAALAGLLVGTHWRWAYLMSVAPALLVLWVRRSVNEPETWRKAGEEKRRMGSFRELFGHRQWALPAVFGLLLAAIGLGTFWGVTVAGQDLTRELVLRNEGLSANAKPKTKAEEAAQKAKVDDADQKAKFAYGIVQAAGGGLGMFCFGPLATRLGRKPTFALMLVGSLIIVPITCYFPKNYGQMLAILPLYGFFTLSIHAGFAVYFPELFPSHLRATGSGVCFNGGRFLAAPILILSGKLKSWPGMDLRSAVCWLSLLFGVGLVVLCFLPETKNRPLPE
ncbi:MAG TPA: MFS transporter [Isosphaeraceae bacterium]|nr:MFS transporter [Isosphaeraceae bacterium]